MKDMMTTIASVLVLMMFLLQFTANQTHPAVGSV